MREWRGASHTTSCPLWSWMISSFAVMMISLNFLSPPRARISRVSRTVAWRSAIGAMSQLLRGWAVKHLWVTCGKLVWCRVIFYEHIRRNWLSMSTADHRWHTFSISGQMACISRRKCAARLATYKYSKICLIWVVNTFTFTTGKFLEPEICTQYNLKTSGTPYLLHNMGLNKNTSADNQMPTDRGLLAVHFCSVKAVSRKQSTWYSHKAVPATLADVLSDINSLRQGFIWLAECLLGVVSDICSTWWVFCSIGDALHWLNRPIA